MLPWSEETPKAGVSTGTQLLNTGGGGGRRWVSGCGTYHEWGFWRECFLEEVLLPSEE